MGIGIPSSPGAGILATLPKFLATNASGQVVGAGASATITGWTQQWSTHGGFVNATGIYTVPYDGFYTIGWSLAGVTTAAASFITRSRLVNSSGTLYDVCSLVPTASASLVPVGTAASITARLLKGQTLTLGVVNGSSNSLTMDNGGNLCWWSIDMTNA